MKSSLWGLPWMDTYYIDDLKSKGIGRFYFYNNDLLSYTNDMNYSIDFNEKVKAKIFAKEINGTVLGLPFSAFDLKRCI